MKKFFRSNLICSSELKREIRYWCQENNISKKLFLTALSKLGLKYPIKAVKLPNSVISFSSSLKSEVNLQSSSDNLNPTLDIKLLTKNYGNYHSNFCLIASENEKRFYLVNEQDGSPVLSVIERTFDSIKETIILKKTTLKFYDDFHNRVKFEINFPYYALDNWDYDSIQHLEMEKSILKLMQNEEEKTLYNIYIELINNVLPFCSDRVELSYFSKNDVLENHIIAYPDWNMKEYQIIYNGNTYCLNDDNSWYFKSDDFKIQCYHGKFLEIETEIENLSNVESIVNEVKSVINEKLAIAFLPKNKE